MGLFDSIKKAFSGKVAEPIPESPGLVAQLEDAATIEPYVLALRSEWLNDRHKGDVADQLIRKAGQRFPQHEALVKILRAIYRQEKTDLKEPPILEYASSLAKTANFAFEGYLYRTKVLFENGRARQAICSAIRAATSDRPDLDFARWHLVRLLSDSNSALYKLADTTLPADDAAVALQLAYVTMRAASDLMTNDWRHRMSTVTPSCVERIAKEQEWTVTARAALLELARENAVKASLNPGLLARARTVAGLQPSIDPISELGTIVVQARTRETQSGFKAAEVAAHQKHMAPLAERLMQLRTDYTGCTGLQELDAEQTARSKPADAAAAFQEILRRRSDHPYYAYRAAQLLDQSSHPDEARRLWVHAARTPGSGWRSRLSRIVAVGHTYEWEAAHLRAAPAAAVPQAAAALAAHLEERVNEAWESYYWPAAHALTGKAAQLYQVAARTTRDPVQHQKFVEKATELYTTNDDLDALKHVHDPAPDAVYEPLQIPFTALPV